MDRIEARNRIDAAMATLRANGWTLAQCARAIDGLQRDDAVEEIERHVAQRNPLFDRSIAEYEDRAREDSTDVEDALLMNLPHDA